MQIPGTRIMGAEIMRVLSLHLKGFLHPGSIHSCHLASSMRSLTIVLFAVLLLALGQADESPGFFLKITKNVPRLGKRTESFVMKNMKTIPRMGRSDPEVDILHSWLLIINSLSPPPSPLSVRCSPGCGIWNQPNSSSASGVCPTVLVAMWNAN